MYTIKDLAEHNSPDKRVWVSYKSGVYDITEWIALHPGGSAKIMSAAGRAIEPFWAMYGQHVSGWVLEILESYRIGNIDQGEFAEVPIYSIYFNFYGFIINYFFIM